MVQDRALVTMADW